MNRSKSFLLGVFFLLSINNAFAKTLKITPVSKSIIPGANAGEGFLQVRVTDDNGNFASDAEVVLTKASSGKEIIKGTPLKFNAVSGDNTLYQINFLSLKPDLGSYTVEITATPKSKSWEENDTEFIFRITGTATISDAELIISSSTDEVDIKKEKPLKIEFGKKLNSILKTEYHQHLYLNFKVKGTSGKEITVQQGFLRLFDEKLGREFIAAGFKSDKGYTAHINLREAANEFYGQSGNYQLQLIVGDVAIKNPSVWTIGTIHINYTSELATEVPRNPFLPLPTIEHQFRQLEKRPSAAVSSAFTIAVVAIPALVLFVGLISVGANLKNFPTGGNFIWAVGFEACIGSILALYASYWLFLNMMQTLTYLAILLVPTLFFAHRNLNALSRSKLHAE